MLRFSDDDLSNAMGMFSAAGQALRTIYSAVRTVSNESKRAADASQAAEREARRTAQQAQIKGLLTKYLDQYPFTFQGNRSDLGYFYTKQELSMKTIAGISEPLRTGVKNNLAQMVNDGILSFDKERGVVTITDTGRSLLNDPQFMEYFLKSNVDYNEEITKAIKAEIDTRKVGVDHPSSVEINYEDGLVNNQNEIIAESGKKAAAKTTTAPKAVGNGAKAAAKTTSGGTKSVGYEAGATVKAVTTGKDIKAAAKVAGKMAGTAAKTARKATGVASGAVTMGVGTAVTVAYEALTSGAKALKKITIGKN